jgi:DNA-binding NarL/FixJ family response regulator
MKKNIGILLVDGDGITRQRLRDTLEAEEGLEVLADYGKAEEAFGQVRTLSPDVILMGIWLSGMDGIEATRRLKKNGPSCGASVVSS